MKIMKKVRVNMYPVLDFVSKLQYFYALVKLAAILLLQEALQMRILV